MLAETPPPRDIGKPRLPVDRVFTLPGIGTVVTGTLFGGTLRRGQSVVIQPSGKTTRIRRIQSHGRDVEASGPGTRTALNLTDVDALEGVHRGDVVTLEELGGPSEILDVLLEISPRAARPLKDGLRVRAHHGSGNVAAHVALASGKELAARRRARSRNCGSRRRRSCSRAIASRCATGRSSTRWRALSSSMPMAIERRCARPRVSSRSVSWRTR